MSKSLQEERFILGVSPIFACSVASFSRLSFFLSLFFAYFSQNLFFLFTSIACLIIFLLLNQHICLRLRGTCYGYRSSAISLIPKNHFITCNTCSCSSFRETLSDYCVPILPLNNWAVCCTFSLSAITHFCLPFYYFDHQPVPRF